MNPNPYPPEMAYKLSAPKGFQCAVGCGHSINVHRTAGCDMPDCDCPAPYGRILPSEEANTPAEIITGLSDRCAAALEDVAALRQERGARLFKARLDRIEAALREREHRG